MVSPALNAIGFILGILFNLYATIVAVRFVMQVVRADYYNPLSQAIVRATKLPVQVLRKIIPSHKNIDFASLVWAILSCFVIIELTALLFLGSFVSVGSALIWALLGIANLVINIYFLGFIVVIVLSWITPRTVHPIVSLIVQLVEPAVRPFRQIVPSFGGLDFSPILVFFILMLLKDSIILQAAINTGVRPLLVPGFF